MEKGEKPVSCVLPQVVRGCLIYKIHVVPTHWVLGPESTDRAQHVSAT